MKKVLLAVAVALLNVGCSVSQEAREARKAEELKEEMALKNALDKRKFKVEINRVIPMGMPPESVVEYEVRIQNDSIYSYLPYVGRAYNIPYDGGVGLNFEEKILSISENKTKNARNIIVKTRNSEDLYTYTFNITASGSTMLYVNAQNRESITFDGDASPIDD